jgi:hypothetical protein
MSQKLGETCLEIRKELTSDVQGQFAAADGGVVFISGTEDQIASTNPKRMKFWGCCADDEEELVILEGNLYDKMTIV